MSTQNDKLLFQFQDHYDLNMKNYFEVYIKLQILQLIQCIVETDNNDVGVRDVETQMQIVFFKIGADFKEFIEDFQPWSSRI